MLFSYGNHWKTRYDLGVAGIATLGTWRFNSQLDKNPLVFDGIEAADRHQIGADGRSVNGNRDQG
jgi:hypothetical protein